MKEIHEKIWNAALRYQDKRDDEGHAVITLEFAQELLRKEKANPDIVIPATTLHDVGWSQMTKEQRFLIFDLNASQTERLKMRYMHQDRGVLKAREILWQVNYDKKLSIDILEIISQHDTREGSFSREDGVVRDADKLWRFSKTGFWADIRRIEIAAEDHYEKIKKQIDEEGFFFTESARIIARKELKERKKEIQQREE